MLALYELLRVIRSTCNANCICDVIGTSQGITPSGAGYGGPGGQFESDVSTADIAGEWYGLTRDPVDMGSGGGGADGGAGGAFLYLRVYETLTLEGWLASITYMYLTINASCIICCAGDVMCTKCLHYRSNPGRRRCGHWRAIWRRLRRWRLHPGK